MPQCHQISPTTLANLGQSLSNPHQLTPPLLSKCHTHDHLTPTIWIPHTPPPPWPSESHCKQWQWAPQPTPPFAHCPGKMVKPASPLHFTLLMLPLLPLSLLDFLSLPTSMAQLTPPSVHHVLFDPIHTSHSPPLKLIESPSLRNLWIMKQWFKTRPRLFWI